jgi:pSer/pThr/pTyr-binding forkhead associated (FHA) protein
MMETHPLTEPAAVLPEPLRLEVCVQGQATVHRVAGAALIGRRDPARGFTPDVDLARDLAVSRRHAQIVARDARYWLSDLHSTNGTLLNGAELAPGAERPLHPGDEIRLGELSVLTVLPAGAPEPPPLPADPDARQALDLLHELMDDPAA